MPALLAAAVCYAPRAATAKSNAATPRWSCRNRASCRRRIRGGIGGRWETRSSFDQLRMNGFSAQDERVFFACGFSLAGGYGAILAGGYGAIWFGAGANTRPCVLPLEWAALYLKWGMTCLPISLMESIMRVWARLPGWTKHSTWSTPASWYFFITSMTSSGVPMAKAPEAR